MLRFRLGAKTVLKSVNTLNKEMIENVENVTTKFNEKIKDTIVENWVKYWKNVLTDYRDVVIDLKKDMKEKPIKAACIVSILGSVVYCARHNPDETNFRDAFVSYENKMLLVHPNMQNAKTVEHLKQIESCYNRQTIKRLNLGIASIIWTDYYSASCNNYNSTCPYLQLQYRKFRERILDIGFLDRWWILSTKMANYDVNF